MKLGILGGTFNPPHIAHVQMAQIARDARSLDRVLFMVSADPPHKTVDGQISALHRLAMTRLALTDSESMEASDLEIQRSGKSYMADTLAALHDLYPEAELTLIVGSDMLLDLKTWYHPERIALLAQIAAIARSGQQDHDIQAAKELHERFGMQVHLLDGAVDPFSSTQVRGHLAAGLPVSHMLPPAVERYCYEEGLYFPAAVQSMQQQVRASLDDKRYAHTMGVVRTAATLAADWGADPEQARLAALLHDCAKQYDPATLLVLGGDDTGIPSVQHAFAGAVVAKNAYGICDDLVLRAIRLHSTGDANMTTLDKVTYLADLTEPNRRFPCVDVVRGYLAEGADRAMYRSLLRTRNYVQHQREQGFDDAFHPAGERAIAWFAARLGEGSSQGSVGLQGSGTDPSM